MKIGIPKEIDPAEPRVAAVPDTVKKLKALGADVAVEPGAGVKSGVPDSEFQAAGATVSADAVKDADIVLKVKRPEQSELGKYKRGALVVAIMDPYGNDAALKAMADAGVAGFAMELMPRITRAQVMDVLSSQANLAGYRAVIEAAEAYGRALPMMMTAAGTVPRPRCSSWASASPACRRSPPRGGSARWSPPPTCGRRPRSRSRASARSSSRSRTRSSSRPRPPAATPRRCRKEYQAKQAALVAEHIKKQDIVITTALIPGRPAPRLVTADMVGR